MAGEKPDPVRTHLRNMIIVPEMIGSIIGVYNGKTFNQVRPNFTAARSGSHALPCFHSFAAGSVPACQAVGVRPCCPLPVGVVTTLLLDARRIVGVLAQACTVAQ